MINLVSNNRCEHCGNPDNKTCYTVTSFPDSTVPSMTVCEDCLKELGEEIAQAFSSTVTTE